MTTMQNAYKIAVAAVKQRFREQRPGDLDVLESVKPGQVAAYSGSYDQVEKLFQIMGVPVDVDPDPWSLSARIVFTNCSSSYDSGLVDRVPALVHAGMWLVGSDWALDGVVEKAFPGLVRWNQKSTPEEIVSVEPARGSLWSEVVVLGADPQWWLWGSHPIEVLDTERVRVEAASHDLLVKYDAPVVACSFDWGRGHVFQVISHFWAKKSGTPTIVHQRPCREFLELGMRLCPEGIEAVLLESGVAEEKVNFAQLQSAATATELVAQLVVGALKGGGSAGPEKAGWGDRLVRAFLKR